MVKKYDRVMRYLGWAKLAQSAYILHEILGINHEIKVFVCIFYLILNIIFFTLMLNST